MLFSSKKALLLNFVSRIFILHDTPALWLDKSGSLQAPGLP
jgi:hypothetical protein